MPKVTLDPWGDKAREVLKVGEVRAHMRPEKIAKMIGVSPSTYYRYRRRPEKLSLEMVGLLCKPMRITDDELLCLMRR